MIGRPRRVDHDRIHFGALEGRCEIAAMPRKPATEQIDTLNEIRSQAFRLFGRYGYDGASIESIASAARLSKGALYWHFRGKKALYIDCLQCLHGIFREYMFVPMQSENDAALKLVRFFQGLASLLADPRVRDGVGGYWLESSTGPAAEFDRVQRAFEAEASQLLAQTLLEGVQQGQLRLTEDPNEMARAILAIMQASVVPLRRQTLNEVHSMLGVLARMFLSAYGRPGELMDLAREI